MKTFKALLGPRSAAAAPVVDVRQTARRVLTEYVLNMAVTCLAQGEIEPLYAQYMEDPRLSDEDRDELARAYLLLQMSSVQGPVPS